MIFFKSALPLFLISSLYTTNTHAAVSSDCANELNGFTFAECDLASIEDAIGDNDGILDKCGDADTTVAALFGMQPGEQGLADAVDRFCNQARDAFSTSNAQNFGDIKPSGADAGWHKRFYYGLTDLNDQRDDDEGLRLEQQGAFIKDAFDNKAQSTVFTPPPANYLDNCEIDAMMCCWVRDRQDDNDNDGGCRSDPSYAEGCDQQSPADNSNACFVDLSLAPEAHGTNNGLAIFRGSRTGNEGDIHCHGLAWSPNPQDTSARYKYNNLFFVSMYDHLYQRGYTRSLPGATMCGCVDKMPVVSRSDCTEMDVEETYQLELNGGVLSNILLTNADITFQACEGLNRNKDGDNNDLRSQYRYYNRNTEREVLINDYLVKNAGGCKAALGKKLEAEKDDLKIARKSTD